jgi:hypothetical protein
MQQIAGQRDRSYRHGAALSTVVDLTERSFLTIRQASRSSAALFALAPSA